MNPFAAWIASVGLTKHDVAVAWGVQDTAIWKITRNGHKIRADTAVRIWRFTGGEVSLAMLLTNGAIAPPTNNSDYRAALKAIHNAERRAERKRQEKINAARKKKLKPRTEARRAEQRPE